MYLHNASGDSDTVVAPRAFLADPARKHVPQDEVGIALERVAVSSGAGTGYCERISSLEVVEAGAAKVLLALGAGVQGELAGAARLPTIGTGGGLLHPVGATVQFGGLKHLVDAPVAQAATVLAGAARVRDHLEAAQAQAVRRSR